jgi:amidase
MAGPLARSVTDLILMLDAIVGSDSDDPVTRTAERHIPHTYRSVPGDSDLGDIQIGVVPPLFGSAPDDAEAGLVVRRAIGTMRSLGALVSEVVIPDYPALIEGTSMVTEELRFDLRDFLAKFPGAPVKGLDEILAGDKYHPSLEAVFRSAAAAESRDSASYRSALAKRAAATDAAAAAMSGVTALAYPTLRRKPALIGQPQTGSNCQLSSSTGFPAISIPAGFTDDGLPVGMELLGLPFTEPALLRIAFAYERAAAPRQRPKSTH